MSVLLKKIKDEYPDLAFKAGKKFSFRPPNKIFYVENDPEFDILILHELAHAILGHTDFTLDIERLKLENEAWEKARVLAIKYSVQINEILIQEELDSYRDWLHSKSKCKKCGLTRYQTLDKKYHCPHCDEK